MSSPSPSGEGPSDAGVTVPDKQGVAKQQVVRNLAIRGIGGGGCLGWGDEGSNGRRRWYTSVACL